MAGRVFGILGNLFAVLVGLGLLARLVSPADFWPPAIIALLLPWLVLSLLVFVGIQLYRRKWRYVVFPVLVLVFAFPSIRLIFAIPDSAPLASSTASERLTVATQNVRVFRGDGRGDNPDTGQVIDHLGGLNTDILLLQETRHRGFKQDFFTLIADTGEFTTRLQPPKKTVATYSRDTATMIASSFVDYNGFIVTDVSTDIGPVRVINAHLQSNQISRMAGRIQRDTTLQRRFNTFGEMFREYGKATRIRASQAEEISAIIDQSPHPVIVGGDFNDVPSSYTYQRILTPRLKDAWAVRGLGLGTTFTGPLPGLRIDYLLVDTSLTIYSVERIDEAWSDHRALRAVIGK